MTLFNFKTIFACILILGLVGCGSGGSTGTSANPEAQSESKLFVIGDEIAKGFGTNQGFAYIVGASQRRQVVNLGMNSGNGLPLESEVIAGAFKQAMINNFAWDYSWGQVPVKGDIIVLSTGYFLGFSKGSGFTNQDYSFDSLIFFIKYWASKGVKLYLLTPPNFHQSLRIGVTDIAPVRTSFENQLAFELTTGKVKLVKQVYNNDGSFAGVGLTDRNSSNDNLYQPSNRYFISDFHHQLIAQDLIYSLNH